MKQVNIWTLLLVILLPINRVQELFYKSDEKVDWYLFRDTKRYISSVIEDYAIAISFIVVFAYICFGKKTGLNKAITKFLFVLVCLDFIHLGLLDSQFLLTVKFIMAFGITLYLERKKLQTAWD